MRDKIIRIEWSNPVTVDDAIEDEASLQPGIYYITRVFNGHESSRYIGKATNTIRERLKDHRKEWLHRVRGQILVRMGTITYPRNADAEIIDHAESALIYEHKDILVDNTDKVKSYSYSELYQIQNTGNIGELKAKIRMHEHPDY